MNRLRCAELWALKMIHTHTRIALKIGKNKWVPYRTLSLSRNDSMLDYVNELFLYCKCDTFFFVRNKQKKTTFFCFEYRRMENSIDISHCDWGSMLEQSNLAQKSKPKSNAILIEFRFDFRKPKECKHSRNDSFHYVFFRYSLRRSSAQCVKNSMERKHKKNSTHWLFKKNQKHKISVEGARELKNKVPAV